MGQPSGNGQGGSPAGQQDQQQGPRQAIEEFRTLAQQIQQLAQKYPEFVESATQILPLIQKGMVKIAGNQERTPEPKAPPV